MMDSDFRQGREALPHVYKFFRMIYALSPIQTTIIVVIFLLQSLIPALRLRTESSFIQVVLAITRPRSFTASRGGPIGRDKH
jgi:hypothetical protein